MTDITELALRLKLEVHLAVSNFNPQMNIKTRDLKELVEALEKAQRRIAELESHTVKPPVHPTVASEKLDDETLQELIEFRRTTFEYHSKEGNKVQTIIHGVTLAALRELQERRKADSEPVATLDVQSRRPDGNKFALVFSSAAHKLPDDVYFLYRHAQPEPEMKPVGYLFVSEQGAIAYSPTDWGMPGFRLAGQIFGDIDVELKPAPVVPLPDVVSVLLNHLEDVLPDDAFNLIDVKAWNAVSMLTCPDACRAAMLQESQKSAGESNNCRSCENVQDLQAGNSPVIPDGLASMLRRWLAFGRGMQNAGCQLPRNLIAETEEMLAAAPQEVKP